MQKNFSKYVFHFILLPACSITFLLLKVSRPVFSTESEVRLLVSRVAPPPAGHQACKPTVASLALRLCTPSHLNTLISELYSGWGGPSLYLLFVGSSASVPMSSNMEADTRSVVVSHLNFNF